MKALRARGAFRSFDKKKVQIKIGAPKYVKRICACCLNRKPPLKNGKSPVISAATPYINNIVAYSVNDAVTTLLSANRPKRDSRPANRVIPNSKSHKTIIKLD